jgi:hypothetical protein
MFEFEKQFKEVQANYQAAVERVLQTYEYWFNSVLSATKDLVKSVKAK